MVLDNGAIPVRASIGISVVDPAYEQGVHPDRLLQRADTAMYRAKSLGGSRTELFDAGSSILEADEDTWSTSIAPAS
jgi:GGDEF domain-containing protein